MKHLSIMVAGTTGSGKTTVANLIRDALAEHGIRATVRDDHRTAYHGVESVLQKKRLEAIRGNKVVITATRVRRESTVAKLGGNLPG